jgi:hypothetical protein
LTFNSTFNSNETHPIDFGRLVLAKKMCFWRKTHKSGVAAIDFTLRARNPFGKWAVTEFFSRSRPENMASFGNGLPMSCRRKRPGVRLGLRSQKPVGVAGKVAARKLKIEPAKSANSGKRWTLSEL